MKKLHIILLIVFILNINLTFSMASSDIKYNYFIMDQKTVLLPTVDVEYNGEKITYMNAGVDPVIIDNRTLVPVRFLSEKMNYKVNWDGKNQKVTIDNGNKKIELFIGKNKAAINGINQEMTDSVPPVVINNRTMVPIRFVVEQFGIKIDYDNSQRKVTLESTKEDNPLFHKKEQIDEKPATPTKPKMPEKPEVPTIQAPNGKNKNLSKIKYRKLEKNNKEIFEIKSDSSNIDYKHFYLESPARLVIDIKSSEIDSSLPDSMNFDNNLFTSINSKYHEDKNILRLVLYFDNNSKKDNIELNKKQGTITISLTEKKKKEIDKNKFALDFERLRGSINLELNKPFDINNDGEKKLNIRIPIDLIDLSQGTLISENNFFENLRIDLVDNNYYISAELKERTAVNVDKITEKNYKISFTKSTNNPPIIVIDPGHGGKDPGAENKKVNINEKTLNILIGKKLKEVLTNKGYEVYMTREEDKFLELNEIAEFGNSHNPDIFVSIHHNAFFEKPTVSGIESFYYQSKDSKKLAEYIQKSLIEHTGANNRGTKSVPYVVIKKTYMPSTLLELGFMSNPTEISKLMTDEYKNTLVDAIANGIDDYFKNL